MLNQGTAPRMITDASEAAPLGMGAPRGTASQTMATSNGINLQVTGVLHGSAPPMNMPMNDEFHEAAPPATGNS